MQPTKPFFFFTIKIKLVIVRVEWSPPTEITLVKAEIVLSSPHKEIVGKGQHRRVEASQPEKCSSTDTQLFWEAA